MKKFLATAVLGLAWLDGHAEAQCPNPQQVFTFNAPGVFGYWDEASNWTDQYNQNGIPDECDYVIIPSEEICIVRDPSPGNGQEYFARADRLWIKNNSGLNKPGILRFENQGASGAGAYLELFNHTADYASTAPDSRIDGWLELGTFRVGLRFVHNQHRVGGRGAIWGLGLGSQIDLSVPMINELSTAAGGIRGSLDIRSAPGVPTKTFHNRGQVQATTSVPDFVSMGIPAEGQFTIADGRITLSTDIDDTDGARWMAQDCGILHFIFNESLVGDFYLNKNLESNARFLFCGSVATTGTFTYNGGDIKFKVGKFFCYAFYAGTCPNPCAGSDCCIDQYNLFIFCNAGTGCAQYLDCDGG